MSKIIQFLDEQSQEDLEIIEKDIKEGYVQKFIERKKEFFKIKGKMCASCGNDVQEDCFVIIWGEPSIRKKAHFCGIDCMEYFVNSKLKKNAKNNKNTLKTQLQHDQK